MTDASGSIALMGAPGSPYTRKMLALLRYRRIAYRFLSAAEAARQGMPVPRVSLLPTFYLPDEAGQLQAVTDSSPLIRRFEHQRAGRSVIPPDPALAFVDALIEDFADEWLTKPMFHFRWTGDEDIRLAGLILPLWRGLDIDDATLDARAGAIRERQIARLGFVGSNAITGPIIEAGYRRILAVLEAHFSTLPFLLGRRPASADFAIFGQLSQLTAFDPTPAAIARAAAPRALAWTTLMEDLSGLEPAENDWIDLASAPPSLRALLVEVGRLYAPVMVANAAAVASGADRVEAVVDGQPWVQAPFPYQAKCLRWLREAYGAMQAPARQVVDAALAGTGCEILLA